MEQETTTKREGVNASTILTVLGAVALAGLTALLAWYNAAGWLDRQFPLLAALAVATEAIAFLMAVCAELAWGRGGHLAVRVLRVACCFIILVGCEAFNAAGSHEAWRGTVAERAETLTKPQRDALAAKEAHLTQAIAEAQARIQAVPAPDLSGGPLNDAQAIAAWQALTEADRAVKAASEQALRDLDRTIDQPEPPFPEVVVWWFLSFLGFVKVAGLWAIGVAFFRSEATKSPQRETEAGVVGNDSGNVVDLLTPEQRKQLVRALRADNVSFGEIERRYGIRKGTAHRWCK
jgi:hypothetical protein